MLTWATYVYERERYENLRREAAKARLIRQAYPRHPAGSLLYRRALNWLGYQLTAWGRRLTEKYGGFTDAASPTSQPRPAGLSGSVLCKSDVTARASTCIQYAREDRSQ